MSKEPRSENLAHYGNIDVGVAHSHNVIQEFWTPCRIPLGSYENISIYFAFGTHEATYESGPASSFYQIYEWESGPCNMSYRKTQNQGLLQSQNPSGLHIK